MKIIPPEKCLWTRVHIDIMERVLDDMGRSKDVIVAIDSLGKYIETEAFESINAAVVAGFIYRNIFCRYGTPYSVLYHDRDPKFVNAVMKVLMTVHRCKIKVTHRAETNGQVERYIQILRKVLTCCKADNGNQFIFLIFCS